MAHLREGEPYFFTVSPPYGGMHEPISFRYVEFNFIRNLDRVKDDDTRAFIGNVADDARQRLATVVEVDDAVQVRGLTC